MVKECSVTLNNDVATVVIYDGVSIQFPAIHKNVKTVFVDKKGEKYIIVDKPQSGNRNSNPAPKKAKDLDIDKKQPKPKTIKNHDKVVTDNIE